MANNRRTPVGPVLPPPPPPPPPRLPIAPYLDSAGPALNLSKFFKNLRLGSGKCRDPYLHQKAYAGDTAELRLLLNKAEESRYINYRNHLGCTPLRLATAKGHLRCAELLLDRGANPNLSDIKAQTPLMMAVKNNHVGCVRALLERGADPNGDSSCLYTPLFWAAKDGNYHIIKELLKHGADYECHRDCFAKSNPVRIAMVYHHTPCLRLLLLAGAEQRTDADFLNNKQENYFYKLALKQWSTGDGEEMIQMLYEFGVPYSERQLLENAAVIQDWQDKPSWVLLQNLFNNPRSLMSSCRISLRRYLLRIGSLEDAPLLPLPRILLDYLMFSQDPT